MKKRVHLILCALLLSPMALLAQQPSFEWVVQTGGDNTVRGNSMTLDSNGNIITTGYFNPSIDLDPDTGSTTVNSNGDRDIYIQKLDKDGAFVWGKTMGGTGYDEAISVTVDANGNIYSTGNFEGTVDFNPGVGVANLTSKGRSDSYIQKLDKDGNFLWVKQIGGTNIEGAFSIHLDNNEDLYVTGFFGETVDFDPNNGVHNLTATASGDIFIQKLNKDGNFIWAKQIGETNYNFGYSLKTDSKDNVLLTGSFRGTVDFNPGAGVFNLESNGNSDVFVLKLKANGDFIWAKSYGGKSSDLGISLAIDNEDNVIVAGGFYDTADLDPGVGEATFISHGKSDCFIQKLDEDGELLWVKQLASKEQVRPEGISVDAVGNIYTTGGHKDTLRYDSGNTKAWFATKSNRTDIFIHKLDKNGELLNMTILGGTSYDNGRDILIDKDLNIWALGDFQISVDFDPGVGTNTLSVPNYSDTYILKLSQCGNLDNSTTLNLNTLEANSLVATSFQWLNCDSSMQSIPGETRKTFTARVNGNYAVEVSAYGCVDTSACVLINTVGIQDMQEANKMEVYPNPAQDFLTIETQGKAIKGITVWNSMGSKVMEIQGDRKTIITHALPKGVYVLQVRLEESIGYSQFIKK